MISTLKYRSSLPLRTILFRPSTTTTQSPKPNPNSLSKKSKKPEDPLASVPSLLISVPLAVSGTIAGGLAAYLGGVSARASRLSPIGAFVLSTLGGAGGGTLRSCLSAQPASWIGSPAYMYCCLALGGAGYLGLLERVRLSKAGKLFTEVIFKLSIPGCAIVGGEVARSSNLFTGALFGLITATGGGFLRDVILSRPPAALGYGNAFTEAAPVMVGSVVHAMSYDALRSRPNVRYLTTIASTLWLNNYLSKRYVDNKTNVKSKKK